MIDLWPLVGFKPLDRNHIETQSAVFKAELSDEPLRSFGEAFNFCRVDGFGGRGAIVDRPSFDLDENQRIAVGHDQIDFAKMVGVAAINRDPTFPQQKTLGLAFTALAERHFV